MANYSRWPQQHGTWSEDETSNTYQLPWLPCLATWRTLLRAATPDAKGKLPKMEGNRTFRGREHIIEGWDWTSAGLTRVRTYSPRPSEIELKSLPRHTTETALFLAMRRTTNYKRRWQNAECISRTAGVENRMSTCAPGYGHVSYSKCGVGRTVDVPIYSNIYSHCCLTQKPML